MARITPEQLQTLHLLTNELDTDKMKDDELENLCRVYFDRDYSKFAELSPETQLAFSKGYVNSMRKDNESLADMFGRLDKSAEAFDEKAVNPRNVPLRIALDFYANKSADDPALMQQAKKLNQSLNTMAFQKTIHALSEDERRQFTEDMTANHATPEQIQQSLTADEQQKAVVGKLLLLAQLANIKTPEKGKPEASPDAKNEDKLFESPVCELLSSGGRSLFGLPANDEAKTDALFRALFGATQGYEKNGVEKGPILESRAAATHNMTLGGTMDDFKERKAGKLTSFNLRGNDFGMNLAAGGLGQKRDSLSADPAKTDKLILNDGSNGYMYVRKENNGNKKMSGFMVGFENSAWRKASAIGAAHTTKGKSAALSAFYSAKGFAPGKELNGRTLDLSRVDTELLTGVLAGYDRLLAYGKNDPQRIDALNKKLMGKQLSSDELAGILANDICEDFCRGDRQKGEKLLSHVCQRKATKNVMTAGECAEFKNTYNHETAFEKKPNAWKRFWHWTSKSFFKEEFARYEKYEAAKKTEPDFQARRARETARNAPRPEVKLQVPQQHAPQKDAPQTQKQKTMEEHKELKKTLGTTKSL